LSVPFLGALPGFLPKERLVCVTPKELSMWELADRLMINLASFHAFLPRVNLVQRIIIRFLRADETRREEGYATTNEEKASDRPETFSEAN
jgi:hypothetical protein